jgi:hypothetical protein
MGNSQHQERFKPRGWYVAAVAFAMLITTATTAAAQAARPPKPGEEVIVRQTSTGEEIRGQLLALSPESLSLLINGRRVDLPIDVVLRVDATQDPLVNGAVIGAVALGGWCAFVCGQGVSDNGDLAKALVVNFAVGAAIGAGLDALHKGRVPIYVRAGKSGAAMQVKVRF